MTVNKTPQNSWQSLKPLNVLPEDFAILAGHRNYSNLRLDALPEQTMGGLDNAEVVFLLLNPGFSEGDITINLKLPRFVEASRRNLLNPYTSPFYYFDGGLERTGGYKWWTKTLKPLMQDGVTEAMLRDKIMAIEFFPYHSGSWMEMPRIPSQQLAFDLVREAIKRNKTLIVRSVQKWKKVIPELETYPIITFSSSMNVVVSPKNIGNDNYARVKKLIMSE